MNPELPKTFYTMSGEVSIAYQVWGSGPIDIVMVPVMLNHLEHLQELDEYVQFMKRLSSFARVIVFDKRGQGLSDNPGPEQDSLETRMDDIRAVMDANQSDKAVIFGQSEGGPMSILFTATHPERVHALILYGTFARFIKSTDYTYPHFDQATLESITPLLLSKWGQGVMSGYLAPSFEKIPEKMDWFAKLERLSNSPGGFKSVLEMNARIDVHPLLEVLNQPTLILHKKDDPGISVDSGRHLHKCIVGSKFVELKGTNHLPYLDDTEALIGEVEEFLFGQKTTQLRTDRVLSTVLFTDIVSSSTMAHNLGDQKWKELLDRHDSMAKAQIKNHRGRFIKSTGDGLIAIFDGPGRAIKCAQKIREQLKSSGVNIRSGLHTGEIEIRGLDIGGITVHIAARVASVADPGEIFVSRTTTDLVAGSGIYFTDKGLHELKGIHGQWRLYAVN